MGIIVVVVEFSGQMECGGGGGPGDETGLQTQDGSAGLHGQDSIMQ